MEIYFDAKEIYFCEMEIYFSTLKCDGNAFLCDGNTFCVIEIPVGFINREGTAIFLIKLC